MSRLSMEKVRAMESLLKTCDRFKLMPPYVVMLERWTKNIGHWSCVDSVRNVYGVTVKMLGVSHEFEIGDEDGN